MAESRREWMLRMMEMWNSGEYDRFLDEVGPDVVFSPDPTFPDAGTYRGEVLRRWIREWAGAGTGQEWHWLTRQSICVCSLYETWLLEETD
jgi:hypothetical protein